MSEMNDLLLAMVFDSYSVPLQRGWHWRRVNPYGFIDEFDSWFAWEVRSKLASPQRPGIKGGV